MAGVLSDVLRVRIQGPQMRLVSITQHELCSRTDCEQNGRIVLKRGLQCVCKLGKSDTGGCKHTAANIRVWHDGVPDFARHTLPLLYAWLYSSQADLLQMPDIKTWVIDSS